MYTVAICKFLLCHVMPQVINEIRYGGATYVSTGRGLPTDRRPFIGEAVPGKPLACNFINYYLNCQPQSDCQYLSIYSLWPWITVHWNILKLIKRRSHIDELNSRPFWRYLNRRSSNSMRHVSSLALQFVPRGFSWKSLEVFTWIMHRSHITPLVGSTFFEAEMLAITWLLILNAVKWWENVRTPLVALTFGSLVFGGFSMIHPKDGVTLLAGVVLIYLAGGVSGEVLQRSAAEAFTAF